MISSSLAPLFELNFPEIEAQFHFLIFDNVQIGQIFWEEIVLKYIKEGLQ